MFTEPPDGSTTTVSLTVNRNGGTVGVVSTQWQIISSDGKHCHNHSFYNGLSIFTGLAVGSDDIRPTSGLIQFSTGSNQRTILLEIQSDNVPEDDEVNSIMTWCTKHLNQLVRYFLFD